MNFNINILDNKKEGIKTISVTMGKDRFSAPFNESIYDSVLALQEKYENAETIEDVNSIKQEVVELFEKKEGKSEYETIDELIVYSNKTHEFYIKTSKRVYNSYPLPKIFVDKIIATREKGLTVLPLVKSCIRLMQNDHYSKTFAEKFYTYISAKYKDAKMYNDLIKEGYTEKEAEQMSTFEDISFTKSGLLNTYKFASLETVGFDKETGEKKDLYKVEFDEVTGNKRIVLDGLTIEDYKLIPPIMGRNCDPFFVDGVLSHEIKVGAVHKLDKFDNTTYTHNYMGKGLYLGGLRYIDGYGGNGRILLNAFVDPANICAFNEGSGMSCAMKVKEYFIHSAVEVPSKALYKESTYLDHSKAEWDKIATETLDAIEAKRIELENEANQIKGLQEEL